MFGGSSLSTTVGSDGRSSSFVRFCVAVAIIPSAVFAIRFSFSPKITR